MRQCTTGSAASRSPGLSLGRAPSPVGRPKSAVDIVWSNQVGSSPAGVQQLTFAARTLPQRNWAVQAVSAAVDSSDVAQQGRGAAPNLAQLDKELLACCQARAKQWCGVKDATADLPVQAQAHYSIRGHPSWRLAATSHHLQASDGGGVCAIVSFTLFCPGLQVTATSKGDAKVSDLQLHWGCSKGPRTKWWAPPAGWHTSPPVSYDAGGGAWQTPFELQGVQPASDSAVGQGPLYAVLLQLPLGGELSEGGGTSFVLKTGQGQWLQELNSNGDFFFSVSTGAPPAMLPQLPQRPQVASPPAAAPAKHKDHKHQVSSQDKASGKGEDGKRYRSQEERNRDELPDITKGVPWSPGEGPRGHGQHGVANIVPMENRTKEPWYSEGLFGKVDEAAIKALVDAVKKSTWESHAEELLAGLGQGGGEEAPTGSGGVCAWMVDAIAAQEGQAERSLMHRYNTAKQLVDKAGASEDAQQALTTVLVWLRLSAARHLTWNRNYNVKPREISAAQDALNTSLTDLFEKRLALRQTTLACMAAAGRGGSSDVGQRIRDEILAVQQRNGCKGGMMEEWHQKLHNNTSPDDVVICQALIAMLEEGLDIRAYWRVLQASGITAQRLASYDRAIRNEPRFSKEQVPGLLVDLRSYLQTLQAVHSGADLGSAAGSVLGFAAKSMKGKMVSVDPVPGVASPELREQLLAVLYQQQQLGSEAAKAGGAEAVSAAIVMLQLVLRARYTIRPFLRQGNTSTGGRLRDVLFLDMSLDSTARTALETVMAQVKSEATAWLRDAAGSGAGTGSGAAGSSSTPGAAGGAGQGAGVPPGLERALQLVALAVENAAVGSELLQQRDVTEDLCKTLKWLTGLAKQAGALERRDWAMQVVAVVDRLKRCLSDHGAQTVAWLLPTASALGGKLNVPPSASSVMCEDAARGSALAPVSQLLAAVEPSVRKLGGQGNWQVISRGNDAGREGVLRYEASLASVQYETCEQPTVLLVDHISGHEEVPEGAVALLTSGDCPDVLSHSAVRARNMGVLMAACLSMETFDAIKRLADSNVSVTLLGAEVKVKKLG